MGTRGLIKIRYRNKLKLALYCNYDSYLTGVGVYIANFIQKLLNNTYDIEIFKQNVLKLKFHTKSDEYVESDKCVESDESDKCDECVESDESIKLKQPDESFKSGDQIKYIYEEKNYIPNIRCNHNECDLYNSCWSCGKYFHQIILEDIYYSKITITHNSNSFAHDKLFCEYMYLIDLDNEKVYLYTELNKKLYIPFILMTKENIEKIDIESTKKYRVD
jgi:hypothetical protein